MTLYTVRETGDSNENQLDESSSELLNESESFIEDSEDEQYQDSPPLEEEFDDNVRFFKTTRGKDGIENMGFTYTQWRDLQGDKDARMKREEEKEKKQKPKKNKNKKETPKIKVGD